MAHRDDLENDLAAAAANAAHCTAPFGSTVSSPTASSAKLDYPFSDGPWFERLCFRLGWRDGYAMRYFGRQGQEQYGVDLIGTRLDGSSAVWQCKNLGSPPQIEDVTSWVEHFRKKWLIEKSLPPPTHFFLCWPHRFADTPLDREWQKLAADMKSSHGILLEPWHRDALDEKLRAAPDIVADLFGNASAEAFLGPDIWPATSPFDPVPFGHIDSYPPRLRRYGDALDNGRLYEDVQRQAALAELMAAQVIGLVRGAPGNGKTFDVLSYCRQQAGEGWRTYYLNLADIGNSFNDVQLVDGIRRRLSTPTQFVIDDCHGHEARLEKIVHLLGQHRHDQHLRVFCLSRYVPLDPAQEREGQQAWTMDLEEKGTVLDLSLDDAFLTNYVEHLRPDYVGLSQVRRRRLHALTGRNLLLLDIYLSSNEPAEFLDSGGRTSFLRAFRNRILGNDTRHSQGLLRLAALAQFELTPPPEWIGGDLHALEMAAPGLLVQAGWPRRTHFVHSSAAELVFHGLARKDSPGEELGHLLREYMLARLREARTPTVRSECLEEANRLLRTRPVLLTVEDIATAHRRWLDDPDIAAALIQASAEAGDYAMVSLALYRLSEDSNPSAAVPFANALTAWLRNYLDIAFVMRPAAVWLFFRGSLTLRRCAPLLWQELEDQIPPDRWLTAVASMSTLKEFLHLMGIATPAFAGRLLAAMPEDYLPRLIAKTRSSGRSIGTLNLALRELGKNAPAQRDSLEARFDPADWLDLIAANGTVSELFKILKQTSPAFAGRLLAAMPEDYLPRLIAKTRSSGRSIGTLDLALRELGKNAPTLRDSLEARFDPADWLDLIAANGTVFELFTILRGTSPAFAGRLLAAMPEDYLPCLIAKTRSSGRSIGTLNQTLKTLSNTAPHLRRDLERRMGAEGFASLLLGVGTLGAFADLGDAFGDEFRPSVLAACAIAPVADWQGLAERSHFFELAEFLVRSESWPDIGEITGARISILVDQADALAQRATWYSLNSGRRQASKCRNPIWQMRLKEAVKRRLVGVDVADLPSADDWAGLSNGSGLLFDARPDLASALVVRLEQAFCHTPRDDGENFARWVAPLVFHLRRSEFLPDSVARCLDSVMAPDTVSIMLRDGDPLQRFLWLWNCFAVYWERFEPEASASKAGGAFRCRWQAGVSDQLLAAWKHSANDMSWYVDVAHVIMHAGLLALLGVPLPRHDKLSWSALQRFRFSLPKTLESAQFGFVPSYFLQYGTMAALEDRNAFRSDRRKMLLDKLSTYDNPTLPVRHLVETMPTLGRPADLAGRTTGPQGRKRK